MNLLEAIQKTEKGKAIIYDEACGEIKPNLEQEDAVIELYTRWLRCRGK